MSVSDHGSWTSSTHRTMEEFQSAMIGTACCRYRGRGAFELASINFRGALSMKERVRDKEQQIRRMPEH